MNICINNYLILRFFYLVLYKINYVRSELNEIIKVLNLQGFNQSVKDIESNIIFYFLKIPKLFLDRCISKR